MSEPKDTGKRSDGTTSQAGTSVDLGDDLLREQTVVMPGASAPGEIKKSLDEVIRDELESANILVNEGMLEEAKKLLRQILVKSPGQSQARKKLSDIHDLELKQIFGDEEPQERRRRRATDAERVSTDLVLQMLDRDLSLGIDDEISPGSLSLASELSLFRDAKELSRFATSLDEHLKDLSAEQHADIGIAFHEMGFYQLAAQQFRKSAQFQGYRVTGTCLLAQALISCGQSFEATLELEPLLEDSDVSDAEKIELMYLMGHAFTHLGKSATAAKWFRSVREFDPQYRDVSERLQRLSQNDGLKD